MKTTAPSTVILKKRRADEEEWVPRPLVSEGPDPVRVLKARIVWACWEMGVT